MKDEQGKMDELSEYAENLRLSIYNIVNQCYKHVLKVQKHPKLVFLNNMIIIIE